MSQSEYVDVETVANAYNVTTATVRAWCRDGIIEGAIHAGRQWRIPRRYATGEVEITIARDGRARGEDDE